MRLTDAAIRSLTCPPGKSEKTYFDDDLPGFGLRTRVTGSKSWLYQYAIGGQTRKVFLGSPDVVALGKARNTAKDLAAAVRLGRDPAMEKQESRVRAAETVGAFLPRFLERQRGRLKPRSYVECERHLLAHAKPLHALPLARVDRRTIATRLMEIAERSGPTAANRVRVSLSGFFSWAAREGLVEANPVAYTNKAVEGGARERVLSDAEIRRIWLALDETGGDYAPIVRLLILLGCRREEVGGLRWSEIDLDNATITLSPARTKNSRLFAVPLSAPALAILEERRRRADGSDFVFGRSERGFRSWAVSKLALDARLASAAEPPTAWVIHDIRRSLSTSLHERFNVHPHVVESILGHVSGHKAGVAGIYNNGAYFSERARALARWAEHVTALVGESAEARIINLR